jgi:hypothetical protein
VGSPKGSGAGRSRCAGRSPPHRCRARRCRPGRSARPAPGRPGRRAPWPATPASPRPHAPPSPTGTGRQVPGEPAAEAVGVAPFEFVEYRQPHRDQLPAGRSRRQVDQRAVAGPPAGHRSTSARRGTTSGARRSASDVPAHTPIRPCAGPADAVGPDGTAAHTALPCCRLVRPGRHHIRCRGRSAAPGGSRRRLHGRRGADTDLALPGRIRPGRPGSTGPDPTPVIHRRSGGFRKRGPGPVSWVVMLGVGSARARRRAH